MAEDRPRAARLHTLLQAFRRPGSARSVQRVGAGVACLDREGRVLMVRRRDNGYWDLPGGRVEPGEAVETAARRELLEESGLTAGALHLLGVFSGPDCRFSYPDGKVVEWVTVLYGARDWQGTPQAASDATETRFWPLDTSPQDVGPATRLYLSALSGVRA